MYRQAYCCAGVSASIFLFLFLSEANAKNIYLFKNLNLYWNSKKPEQTELNMFGSYENSGDRPTAVKKPQLFGKKKQNNVLQPPQENNTFSVFFQLPPKMVFCSTSHMFGEGQKRELKYTPTLLAVNLIEFAVPFVMSRGVSSLSSRLVCSLPGLRKTSAKWVFLFFGLFTALVLRRYLILGGWADFNVIPR